MLILGAGSAARKRNASGDSQQSTAGSSDRSIEDGANTCLDKFGLSVHETLEEIEAYLKECQLNVEDAGETTTL